MDTTLPSRFPLRFTLAGCVLLAASLACGRPNTGVLIATATPSTLLWPATVSSQAVYRVGEVIQFSDHTIVLNEARISGDILQTNFTVNNGSTHDVNISSYIQFDARLPDGTKLERAPFDCPGANLDGKVLPGDKLKGYICWKGVTGSSLKLYYIPNPWASGAAVWEVYR